MTNSSRQAITRRAITLRNLTAAFALAAALATIGVSNRIGRARADDANPTSEQLQKMEDHYNDGVRKTLKNAGFTDKAMQDSVIQFADERYDQKQPLETQARRLMNALHNQASSDDEIKALLATVQDAVATERERRASQAGQDQLNQQKSDLDKATSYTTKPRLEALLTMMGLLGDEAQLLGTPPAASFEGQMSGSSDHHSGGRHRGGMGGGGFGMPGGGL